MKAREIDARMNYVHALAGNAGGVRIGCETAGLRRENPHAIVKCGLERGARQRERQHHRPPSERPQKMPRPDRPDRMCDIAARLDGRGECTQRPMTPPGETNDAVTWQERRALARRKRHDHAAGPAGLTQVCHLLRQCLMPRRPHAGPIGHRRRHTTIHSSGSPPH